MPLSSRGWLPSSLRLRPGSWRPGASGEAAGLEVHPQDRVRAAQNRVPMRPRATQVLADPVGAGKRSAGEEWTQ
jgi:hypothetical protein